MDTVTALVSLLTAALTLGAAWLGWSTAREARRKRAGEGPLVRYEDGRPRDLFPVRDNRLIVTPEQHRRLSAQQLDSLYDAARRRGWSVEVDGPAPARRAGTRIVVSAAWLLPQRHRGRYVNEWLAELDLLVAPRARLAFALRVVTRIVSVRVARRRSGAVPTAADSGRSDRTHS